MNLYAIYGDYYAPNGFPIAPVGTASLGAGRWGQFDLVGDEIQWALDWSQSRTYPDPCSDCAYLTSPPQSTNLERSQGGGGSLYDDSFNFNMEVPTIGYDDPTHRSSYDGFRCARTE
jgi:hypothetical protein